MKHAQQISLSVGQLESVITFDLAIYVKAKQIQLKFPDEFSDTILHLGGFHIALELSFHHWKEVSRFWSG